MNKSLLIALCALAAVGCSSLKSKIVGNWMIDGPTMKSPFLDALKKDPKMEADMRKGLESGRFEFKEDGTVSLTSTLGGVSKTGKWTLKDHTITLTVDGPQGPNPPKVTVNDDGSRIHISQGTGQMAMEMDLVKAPK
ncbi:MAG TPA: lipocalin family protein [Fimbriimonadaceae bacterium]|nr:lipocalin family protein [Fimbriimonadaceae bacterium]